MDATRRKSSVLNTTENLDHLFWSRRARPYLNDREIHLKVSVHFSEAKATEFSVTK